MYSCVHVCAYPCVGEQEPQSGCAGNLECGSPTSTLLGTGPRFLLACPLPGILPSTSSVWNLGMLWLQIYVWGSSCILGIQAQVLTLPQWIIYSLSWILSLDPWSFDGRTLYQLYQHHRVKQSPGWCFWCSSGREWNMNLEGGGRCLRTWHLVYPLIPTPSVLTGVN